MSFFPRGVWDEILNLIESVSEGFPSYSYQRYKGMNGQDGILKNIFLCGIHRRVYVDESFTVLMLTLSAIFTL